MSKMLKILFSLANMLAWPNQLAAKVRDRFKAMLWLEGVVGHLWQHNAHTSHLCLILSIILCGSRVICIPPNLRRDMVPWSIRGVTDLPLNVEVRKMQQKPFIFRVRFGLHLRLRTGTKT